jgi:hypothetical protein
VTVIGDLDERSALEYKTELEGLGFLPIRLDFERNPVSVLYGEFPTQEAAIRSRESLRAAGFTPGEVLATRADRGAGAGGSTAYRVQVEEVGTQEEALALQRRLEQNGFLFVEMNPVGNRIQVLAGQYQDPDDARNLLALLKSQGFTAATLLAPDNHGCHGYGARRRHDARDADAGADAGGEPVAADHAEFDLAGVERGSEAQGPGHGDDAGPVAFGRRGGAEADRHGASNRRPGREVAGGREDDPGRS